MKFLSVFTTVLLLALHGFAVPAPIFKLVSDGTIYLQHQLPNNQGRIHVEKLNTRRIFREFGVSPKDYALVLDSDIVELLPLSASSKLPSIEVLILAQKYSTTVFDTKFHIGLETDDVSSTATGNIFENLAGTAFIRSTLKPQTTADRNATIHVTAVGTNQASAGTLLINFKLKTDGVFAQKP